METIREGIGALTRVDSGRLEQLASQAGDTRPPISESERRTAAGEYRALGRLVELTSRNLRLLGREAGSPDEYGARSRT